MRSHSELYVHLVWATWDRTPWVVPEARASVYRCIEGQALKYDSHVVAVGGVADHVHVVARFPARLSVSDLAKQLKGASSHHANDMRLARPFRWQGCYGAFSVSRRGLDAVCAYVHNQERHHAEGTTIRVLEMTSSQ